jgi:hypothetical protein
MVVVWAHTGAALKAMPILSARIPSAPRRLIAMSISFVVMCYACTFFVYVYKMRHKKYNVNQVTMIF